MTISGLGNGIGGADGNGVGGADGNGVGDADGNGVDDEADESPTPSDIQSIREEHGAVDPADPREDRAPVGSDACAYTSYEDGEAPDEYPKTGAGTEGVARDVWNALYEVQDPEMPVSVVDLGLIYDVEVEGADNASDGDGEEVQVTVEMTLTYTGCPARDVLTNDVRCAAETVSEVANADVRLRYSPEWNVNMVTDRGRTDLHEFGLSV